MVSLTSLISCSFQPLSGKIYSYFNVKVGIFAQQIWPAARHKPQE
jgi:hypothetical protein